MRIRFSVVNITMRAGPSVQLVNQLIDRAKENLDDGVDCELPAIGIVGSRVNHVLQVKVSASDYHFEQRKRLARVPCSPAMSSSSSFNASVASASSPICTNWMPNLFKGTPLRSRR
jgi:hypothetical protein